MNREHIGFIGLGKIGLPVALNLLKAGFELTAYDRWPNADNLRELQQAGGHVADSPAALFERSAVVITLLPDSVAVRTALLGEEAAPHLRAGTVCIEMTSGYPPDTVAISEELASRGVELVDAPISNGGVRGAYTRGITLTVGGADAVVDRIKPILEAMADNIQYVGPVGSGQTVKLFSNIFANAVPALMSEIFAVGKRCGFEPERLASVLEHCAANFAVNIKGLAPILFDSGEVETLFRASLARKDLMYAARLAEQIGMPHGMTEAARQLFEQAEQAGYADTEARLAPWKYLNTHIAKGE